MMSVNLIQTKIIVPRSPPGAIHRPRLVDFLHENLERKLLLVTAPAGYGKTTLLIDFAADAGFPVCWYTLDEEDRDPGTFLAYLVASLRQEFPGFGARSVSLLEQGVVSARAAAAAIVADIAEAASDYFVLILDDWHHVSGEAVIGALLDQLLRYLPEQAHLIVAGRALPRGPLVRLAAQGAVAGLGANDLRFTPAEVRQTLASAFGLEVTDEQAGRIVDESEGWITGILLTSQRAWRGLLSGLIHTATASGTLYDYLAGEVFDRLPIDLRRFLLQTAVLRVFTMPLCDEIRGEAGSDEWIDQVEVNNLFLTRTDVDGETWYRYHQLFREFLLARFKHDHPDAFVRLQLRCGEIFESRRQSEEAVDHYLAAGAPERAAVVMDAAARDLFLAGRTQTLLWWAERLPSGLRSIAPELVLYQGQTLSDRGHQPEALSVLGQAESGFRARGDSIGQVRATVAQGWAHYATGNLREALAIGERVLARLDEAGARDSTWEAQALRLIGASYSGLGQWPEGERYLAQALALFRRIGSDPRQAFNLGRTLHDLALALRFMGRLEEAAALEAESLALWRQIGSPGPLSASLNNMGYDRHLAGDYDGALTLYTEALAKADEAEDKRTQAWVLDSIAAVHRDRGEFQRSIEIYDEVFALANDLGDRALATWSLDGSGHAFRLKGDLDRALGLFEQARNLAERDGIRSQVTLSTASVGIARVEQGRVAEGIADLERGASSLRGADSDLDLARVSFWLAHAYHAGGQTLRAREALAETLRLGSRLGCRPFSLAESHHSTAFLAWGVEQLDSSDRLRAWLEESRADIEQAPVAVTYEVSAAPRIEVRAFGAGQVFRDGRLLTVSDWSRSAVARELFFYLLARSPRRKEEIGGVFWPDLLPARMTSTFHAVKYKTHHALGVEFVIYEGDCYQINPAAGIVYDVAEFTRLLDAAYRRQSDDARRQAEFQQAVALYTGDYLTDVYSEWAIEVRRLLRERYFEALSQLVAMQLSLRQFESALDLCWRGLEIDFFRENLHRGLIECLAEMDRHTEALAHYEAWCQRLADELSARPEKATSDLADSIRLRHSD